MHSVTILKHTAEYDLLTTVHVASDDSILWDNNVAWAGRMTEKDVITGIPHLFAMLVEIPHPATSTHKKARVSSCKVSFFFVLCHPKLECVDKF
jgi:hypothetical protein